MNYVGEIEFKDMKLQVWGDLFEPWFKAVDIARYIDYSNGDTHHMLDLVEEDEKRQFAYSEFRKGPSEPPKHGGRKGPIWMVNELGLYNILSQSSKPIARMWRRVVHSDLIDMRTKAGRNITSQFKTWDELSQEWEFDPEYNRFRRVKMLPGGDIDLYD